MILITNNMEHRPGEGGTAIKLAEDIYIDEECVRDVVREILKKRRGRWERRGYHLHCSCCDWSADLATPHCPGCGAYLGGDV